MKSACRISGFAQLKRAPSSIPLYFKRGVCHLFGVMVEGHSVYDTDTTNPNTKPKPIRSNEPLASISLFVSLSRVLHS